MTTTGRGDFDLGGSLRAMPNFGNLRIGPAYPRRNSRIDPAVREHHFDSHRQCRCLGPSSARVTGDVLGERHPFDQSAKAVQETFRPDPVGQESANVPSNEG